MLVYSAALSSCTKDAEIIESGSINVVNAAVNIGAVKVNASGSAVKWGTYTGAQGTVNYSASKVYPISIGSIPVTIVPTADTLNAVFNSSINIEPKNIYSLYVLGQSPTYETILVKENLPIIPSTDSSFNIRFINLSPNAPAVNVTLSTTTTVNEFAAVSYKSITDFKNYSAKTVNGTNYIYQVRNASTNALITSFTLSLTSTSPRFHNVTLVLKGLVGTTTGTNAIGVLRVNNY